MDATTLSWILGKIPPAATFNISGDQVDDEASYDGAVAYNNPSLKPTWAQVQDGVIPQQWIVVRGKRLLKLSASDWSVLPDVPLDPSVLAEWETYRQALRDVTDQSDPFNIVWPTPPA
jgi:hypothetical protein